MVDLTLPLLVTLVERIWFGLIIQLLVFICHRKSLRWLLHNLRHILSDLVSQQPFQIRV